VSDRSWKATVMQSNASVESVDKNPIAVIVGCEPGRGISQAYAPDAVLE
jgi:hypothetical protein